MRKAAWLLRPKRFWLRFFAANWYATAICLLVLGVAINSVFNHQRANWTGMAVAFGIGTFFIGFSWYRWKASLSKAAQASSARSGSLSLDADGIRTTLSSGASTFVPWSSYSSFIEGTNVFVLKGDDGAAVPPIDDGQRDTIRLLLIGKVGLLNKSKIDFMETLAFESHTSDRRNFLNAQISAALLVSSWQTRRSKARVNQREMKVRRR